MLIGEDVEVPPVSKTAWYTLASRNEDATKKNSICNDQYAKDLMSEEAKEVFKAFVHLKEQNAMNVVRHRIIDDEIQEILNQNEGNVRIFLLGAGFDTRAFRLCGGRWVEFDDPAVIEYKNDKLPAYNCSNKLSRITIDWTFDDVILKLNKFLTLNPCYPNEKTIVVYEGVFMYLHREHIMNVLTELKQVFPTHILICDLLSKYVFDWYSQNIHRVIKETCKAEFHCYTDPWNTMLDQGYELVKNISCIERASELHAIWHPRFLFRGFLFTGLRKGYGVWIWKL